MALRIVKRILCGGAALAMAGGMIFVAGPASAATPNQPTEEWVIQGEYPSLGHCRFNGIALVQNTSYDEYKCERLSAYEWMLYTR